MEKPRLESTGYEEFARTVRNTAQLEAAVCRAFNLSVPQSVVGDFKDYLANNLQESYLRMKSLAISDELVLRVKSDLRDYVLDNVTVPVDAAASMDWEEFSELVDIVIETTWEGVVNQNDATSADYFATI